MHMRHSLITKQVYFMQSLLVLMRAKHAATVTVFSCGSYRCVSCSFVLCASMSYVFAEIASADWTVEQK